MGIVQVGYGRFMEARRLLERAVASSRHSSMRQELVFSIDATGRVGGRRHCDWSAGGSYHCRRGTARDFTRPEQIKRVQRRLTDLYSNLVRLYIRSGQIEAAFSTTERARAALLMRRLQRGGPTPPNATNIDRDQDGDPPPRSGRKDLLCLTADMVLVTYFALSDA